MSVILQLQLGGQLRTLKFNNWQKEALGNILGKDPLQAGKTLSKKAKESPLEAVSDLVYTGMIGAYRSRKADVDFTEADVFDWVGEADYKELATVFDAWVESTGLRKLIPEVKSDGEETGKKKESESTPGTT